MAKKEIPGYSSLKKFATTHNLLLEVVYMHLRNGYCSWPRRASVRTEENKHNHPLYSRWRSMIYRCYDKNHHSYTYYGARGIKVSNSWRIDFWNFVREVGLPPGPEYSLDRIDVNGNYCKENCRWATSEEQASNRRRPITGGITYRAHHRGKKKDFTSLQEAEAQLKLWQDEYQLNKKKE